MRAIRANVTLKLGLTFLIIYLIATFGIYIFEHNKNQYFETLPMTFWSTLIYIVSGFEGREPLTFMGKFLSFIKEESVPKPHIVTEAVNPRKSQHLKDAGIDEVICPVNYGIGLLVQCALYKRLSEVYEQLLSYSIDTCEIYLLKDEIFSKWIKNKSFREVVSFVINNSPIDNPVILIGIKREGKILLNPVGDFKLNEKDSLIAIAYKKPDIREIIKKEGL